MGYLLNTLSYAGCFVNTNVLDLSLRYLTSKQKREIVIGSIAYLEKIKFNACELGAIRREYKIDNVSDVIGRLNRNEYLKKRIFRSVVNVLGDIYKKSDINKNEKVIKKLNEIGQMFSLNNVEQELLLLFHLINADVMVDVLYEGLNELMHVKTFKGVATRNKRPFSILTGYNMTDVNQALCISSTLLRSCIVDDGGEVPSEIMGFIEGSNNTPISGRYFQNYTGDAVPLSCHTVDNRHVSIVKSLFENKTNNQGVNVLFYGEAGTGKTEFARSLSKSLGFSVYEICNLNTESNKENDINFYRYRALQACQQMVDLSTSVIIVDEADALLNSIPGFMSFDMHLSEKGQINRLLDGSKARIIWIVNRFDSIDESTKRRFDYSIKFEKLTFVQRRIIWQNCVKKHKLSVCLSEREIDSLASEYEISAGGIDVALRNAERIYAKTRLKKNIVENVRAIIKSHLTILDQDRPPNDAKIDDTSYSLEGLNIKGNVKETIALIEKFNEHWQNMDENLPMHSMNMLLFGPPGSGKTAFARFVARRMHRRLIIRRASDFLSCYVGETEKTIKRAFIEAEREKSILFIDEADGMFWSREGAHHSWEVSQVNELLTHMETFHGMLICATNFRQIVDSAAIRRFAIKLEFDFLKTDGVLHFYKLIFNELVRPPLSALEIDQLRSLSGLTPGDFRTVHQKYFYFNKKKITHEMLIAALKQELTLKDSKNGRKMGFNP
jgi:SpoVK/Ycf46/Vps4 family AAA+-type ATPase